MSKQFVLMVSFFGHRSLSFWRFSDQNCRSQMFPRSRRLEDRQTKVCEGRQIYKASRLLKKNSEMTAGTLRPIKLSLPLNKPVAKTLSQRFLRPSSFLAEQSKLISPVHTGPRRPRFKARLMSSIANQVDEDPSFSPKHNCPYVWSAREAIRSDPHGAVSE
jgi:hypothetical protein